MISLLIRSEKMAEFASFSEPLEGHGEEQL